MKIEKVLNEPIEKGNFVIKKNTTTIKDTWTIFEVTSKIQHVLILKSVECKIKPYLCDNIYDDIADENNVQKIRLK